MRNSILPKRSKRRTISGKRSDFKETKECAFQKIKRTPEGRFRAPPSAGFLNPSRRKGSTPRFGQGFGGRLVTPDCEEYHRARRVWNAAVDKRPAAIAYCRGTSDVRAALALGRARDLPIAIRSGGHNIAGVSVCENGLVIDLSEMKTIEVNSRRRIARAAAGLTLGEFDSATQAFGLATTMGVNSDTGIAGLTLGGGFGKLGRKFGLACDNLLSAEVVTADSRVLLASETENADLFWGIRGGGGNFGVVHQVRVPTSRRWTIPSARLAELR